MLRCKEGAGRFRVGLRINHQAGPYRVQILGHHDLVAEVNGERQLLESAPWAGVDEPYEGDLCVHELQWLTGMPGREWRPEYEWTIEALKG